MYNYLRAPETTENLLQILFSMLSVREDEREALLSQISKKPGDKAKSFYYLLFARNK